MTIWIALLRLNFWRKNNRMQDFGLENQKFPAGEIPAPRHGRGTHSRTHPNTAFGRVRGLCPQCLERVGACAHKFLARTESVPRPYSWHRSRPTSRILSLLSISKLLTNGICMQLMLWLSATLSGRRFNKTVECRWFICLFVAHGDQHCGCLWVILGDYVFASSFIDAFVKIVFVLSCLCNELDTVWPSIH